VLAKIWLLMVVLMTSSVSAVLLEPISTVLSIVYGRVGDVTAGRRCLDVYNTSVGRQVLGVIHLVFITITIT